MRHAVFATLKKLTAPVFAAAMLLGVAPASAEMIQLQGAFGTHFNVALPGGGTLSYGLVYENTYDNTYLGMNNKVEGFLTGQGVRITSEYTIYPTAGALTSSNSTFVDSVLALGTIVQNATGTGYYRDGTICDLYSCQATYAPYQFPYVAYTQYYGAMMYPPSGYLGLELTINGELHYGWAGMTSDINGMTMTIWGMAYEDVANTAVTNGSMQSLAGLPGGGGSGTGGSGTGGSGSGGSGTGGSGGGGSGGGPIDVPEPSSILMLLTGAAGLFMVRRRRQTNVSLAAA